MINMIFGFEIQKKAGAVYRGWLAFGGSPPPQISVRVGSG